MAGERGEVPGIEPRVVVAAGGGGKVNLVLVSRLHPGDFPEEQVEKRSREMRAQPRS